jgi:hypothetical protein
MTTTLTKQSLGLCPKGYCLLKRLIPDEDLSIYLDKQYLSRPPITHVPVIFDVSEGCKNRCIRKRVAERVYTRRALEQAKCQDVFKWLLSERVGEDIGEDISTILWIKKGFAKDFEKAYEKCEKESGRHWDTYRQMEKDKPKEFWDNLTGLAKILKQRKDSGLSIYNFKID